MADARIKYATKQGKDHESITHVGGDSWTWAVADVVASINEGTNTFYVHEADERTTVGIYRDRYLRTHADGEWRNNLLALPACIVAAA